MEYICQIQDGYMLAIDDNGKLIAKYIGYPYPDTCKNNTSMLRDLLYREFGRVHKLDWVTRRYGLMKSYVMDCVYNDNPIDINVLYSKMKNNRGLDSLPNLKDKDVSEDSGRIYVLYKPDSEYFALLFENIAYIYDMDGICSYFGIRFNYSDITLGKTSIISFLSIEKLSIFDLLLKDEYTKNGKYVGKNADVVNSILSLAVKSDGVSTLVDTMFEMYADYSFDVALEILGMVNTTEIIGRYFQYSKQGIDEFSLYLDRAVLNFSSSNSFSRKLVPLIRSYVSEKYNFNISKFQGYILSSWEVVNHSGVTTSVRDLTIRGIVVRMAKGALGVIDYNKNYTEDEEKYFECCIENMAVKLTQRILVVRSEDNREFIVSSMQDINIGGCYSYLKSFSSVIDKFMLGFKPTVVEDSELIYSMDGYFDSRISEIMGYFLRTHIGGEQLPVLSTRNLPETALGEVIQQMFWDVDKYTIFAPQLYKKIKNILEIFLFDASMSMIKLEDSLIKKYGKFDLFSNLYITNYDKFRSNFQFGKSDNYYVMTFIFSLTNIVGDEIVRMRISDAEFKNLRLAILIEFLERLIVIRKIFLEDNIKFIDCNNIEFKFDTETQKVTVGYKYR